MSEGENGGEFELITRYLTQTQDLRDDVACGIGDDAAIVTVPSHQHLIVSTDTFNRGSHFSDAWSPNDIGYKALAVALSDMAAMGATPAWVSMSLSMTDEDHHAPWLQGFSEGFLGLVRAHGLQLIGGDVVRGATSIGVHVLGLLDKSSRALRRNSAKIGDDIYLTGDIGAAGLAWQCLQGQRTLDEDEQAIVMPYLFHPIPHLEQGRCLLGRAHAAIDVSDGVAADLMHILKASKVGATLDVASLPLHPALTRHLPQDEAWRLALSAGDDYRLCFTAPANVRDALRHTFRACDAPLYKIGTVEATQGLRCKMPNGTYLVLNKTGHRHF